MELTALTTQTPTLPHPLYPCQPGTCCIQMGQFQTLLSKGIYNLL